jgi:tetratricopeptide (TPR) repeat protein
MKICPFMSHMLGADGNVLEIEAGTQTHGHGGDVVVLGYDGDAGVGVKTERKPRTDAKPRHEHSATSHLYCLRETCRFYRTDDGECTFDAIFADVNRARKAAEAGERALEKSQKKGDKPDDTSVAVARELDKFWKFQTKSIAEMIASFGEVEKRQAETLTKLKSDVDKRIASLVPSDEEEDERHETMNTIKDGVAEIKDTIDARNDGFETLTTTVSDLVLGFDDSIRLIKDQWGQIMTRINALESIPARMQSVETSVNKTVENIDRLERNWAELMDVVRSDKKKDDSAAQGKRREAMKFNNLGVTSFHNGDMKLARDQFLEALKRDDSFAECYNNLGLVYTEMGENDRAAEAFTKAIKLNPELHAAYNNLGYVYYKQGNFARAVDMYNEALSRSTNNSAAYTNLGNAHFKLGHKDEARRAWKKAIELDPSNEKAVRSLKSLDD